MLLSSITLNNILSFKDPPRLELRPLNVLIGPNASGKSNLIEIIGLLRAAPRDLRAAVLNGGGARAWIWDRGASSPIASIECRVAFATKSPRDVYKLAFTETAYGFVIVEEQFQALALGPRQEPSVYFDRAEGRVAFKRQLSGSSDHGDLGTLSVHDSVLAQSKSPVDPTPTTRLGREFERIRIYREFRTGPSAQARTGVSASIGKEPLYDGGDNLAVVLNEMRFKGTLTGVHEYLRRFCEDFNEVLVRLDGGIAQTYIREGHLSAPTPAIRLSDGTLKFLSLLAVLLDPDLPSLACIEEPELGLHPDALQIVAEALIQASEQTQLVVTTHSQALVDALSDRPETIVVCERGFDHGTQFRRLSKKELDLWLERYTLGEIWRKGEIGGNRW